MHIRWLTLKNFTTFGILVLIISLGVVFLDGCVSKTSQPPPTVTAVSPTPAPALTQPPESEPQTPPQSPTYPQLPPPPVTPDSQQVTVNLIAENMAFDKKTIMVHAGASVTISFANRDKVPHNFALYMSARILQPIFQGENTMARPIQYKFTAPAKPGTYFFRCDNHPETMNGDFIVK